MVAGSHGSVDPNATTKVALLLDICKVSASFRFDQLVFFLPRPNSFIYNVQWKIILTSRKERLVFPELKFLFSQKPPLDFFTAIWNLGSERNLQSDFFFLSTVRLNRSFKLDLVNKNQTFYLLTW